MRRWIISLLVLLSLVATACDTGGAPTATAVPPAPTNTTAAVAAPTDTVAAVAAPTDTAATMAATPASTTASGAATPASTAASLTITPAPLSGDPIPIGIGVAQTSNTALLGQEEVIGAQIAETFFNTRGGVNGRPIKLIYEDTGGDEAGAINSFTNLINKDNVVAIVGPTLSQQAFSADPIADRAHVPVLGPSNTAAGIPQIGDYIARVSAPIARVAPNAVKAALQMNPNIKKVAVFYAQNDAFSKSETATFQKTVTSTQGLEMVTVQTFQTTDTDFTTQATAALALQPDLCIISGLTTDGGNLVKQLRDLGFKGLIIGGNGLNTPNIFPVCKAACDGVIIAQAYSPAAAGDVNAAFRQAYQDLQHAAPPQLTAQAFTAVQVIVQALATMDSKTKLSGMSLADIRTQLNQQILAGQYDTPLGPISFDKEGEVNQSQFYVAQIKMNADGTTGQFTYLP